MKKFFIIYTAILSITFDIILTYFSNIKNIGIEINPINIILFYVFGLELGLIINYIISLFFINFLIDKNDDKKTIVFLFIYSLIRLIAGLSNLLVLF